MNPTHQRWAISREWLPKLTAFFRDAAVGKLIELAGRAEQVRSERLTAAEQYGKASPARTAVIPIRGVIEYDPFWWGCSCQEISLILDILADRGDIDRVVLNINSPGGESSGILELANKIYGLRSKFEIVAIANCMACSAGHWIGSAAEKFYSMVSGDVGSVGVYMMHVDQSGLLEKEGVKVSFVQAGLYKTEGNPYAPLDPTARYHIQARVDEDYR
jgi:ClpP class serine protease